jgi:DNA-binding transcriptional regulator YiaG
MMTDEQRLTVTELKAAIEATAPTKEGTPCSVRAAVVALKVELRRTGTTARVLAAALGMHESTLSRWERDRLAHEPPKASGRDPGPGFRMVQVAMPPTAPVELAPVSPGAARGLRVAHAPSGLVIDGFDVETLAALLRRMS